MKTDIQITSYTAVSALGFGRTAHIEALLNEQCGTTPCDFKDCDLDTYIGRINDIESVSFQNSSLKDFESRNNKIAYKALMQDGFDESLNKVIKQYGAHRIGIVIGSSTSGFVEFEELYEQAHQTTSIRKDFPFMEVTDFYATPKFIATMFDITGPSYAINTACSSSAKAVISAVRMLQSHLCDAVLVGGVDSLCLNTLYGFASLELLSNAHAKPCDKNRRGLNIGEAGAFLLLERSTDSNKLHVLGYGESADAYHMSSPHPEGKGAALAMQQALSKSGLDASQIDYINMHGTASIINDRVEDIAIHSVFSDRTPCSSTKGWTGHTLGAAGALEAVISCIALQNDFIPGCLNSTEVDPEFKSNVQLKSHHKPIKKVLSNSFGFGGNNCSLIIGQPL